MYKGVLKQLVDFVLAFVAFIILLPVIIFITFFLFIANAGFPFFTQIRVGREGRLFQVLKFKTMNDKQDVYGNLLPDHQRMTRAGKFIRSTSLDELPQLFNVLLGDMSLIGPRPLLVKYLPLYNERQTRRHEVKPGITGLAQVNGRNSISWKERFELDVYYVDHISFVLDLKILLMTIKNVLKREGISAKGNATMEAFKGN